MYILYIYIHTYIHTYYVQRLVLPVFRASSLDPKLNPETPQRCNHNLAKLRSLTQPFGSKWAAASTFLAQKSALRWMS